MLKIISNSKGVGLSEWLANDRQWRRPHRIAYAKQMLLFAHAKKDQQDIVFWRAVIAANDGR